MNKNYDLNFFTTVPKKLRSKNSTVINKNFHGKFSVIFTLLIPLGLRVWNCSHSYHSKSQVNVNSKINAIILHECFILFICGLIHVGLLSLYTNKGKYYSNERSFFTIIEKVFRVWT